MMASCLPVDALPVDAVVCCPLCGSAAVDFPGSLRLGGCPAWSCPACGASGWLSTGRDFDGVLGLSLSSSSLWVEDFPGWSGFGVPLIRPLGECVAPAAPVVDDCAGLWAAGGARDVCAASGVVVGSVRRVGAGCFEAWDLLGRRGGCLSMADGPGDLREWVRGGPGVLPVGCFVGAS